MMSHKFVTLPLLAVAMLSLTACETIQFQGARIYGECSGQIGGGGGTCKVGGELKWEGDDDGGGGTPMMMALASAASAVPDAANFTIDTSGSTIPYPSSGTFLVTLKVAATDTVVASKNFAWIRTGAIIRPSNPDAINDWAYANAGNADSITYDTSSFYSAFAGGMQTIAGSSNYEGSEMASYESNFYGGPDCLNHPSPWLCQGN